MNWYQGDWNYHPLLPPKRMQNVEEIAASGCNMLFWCSMGSGMIGPQMLDEELFGQPAKRTRFYGFLNDKEFAAECRKRGIASFGVIWRSQLWEFPAEFNEDETEILSFNKLRGVGKKGWIGIRELSTDRYPKIFPSIKKYFPEGLRNSRGELIHDFLEEFTVKTLEGNKIRSMWLQVPGHDHQCYTPCCNNPAFLEYCHHEIREMVKAGTSGVFLDECSTARHAMLNSGCFCYDCMKNFAAYLKENGIALPEGCDYDSFDYGEYLRSLGYCDQDLNGSQQELRFEIPLYREFVAFQSATDVRFTKDLIEYAHACGDEAGYEVLVAANMFNFQPEFAPVRKAVDYYGGENTDIVLRNDAFYRFSKGFAGEKKGFYTQDHSPYVLEIVDDIKNGKNDTYTLMLMEALAHGIMNSVPYGSWLLNYAKEAFWPNLPYDKKLGEWQQKNEKLFLGKPKAAVAVVYDQRAAWETSVYKNGHVDEPRKRGFRYFHQVLEQLSRAGVLYNVLYADAEEPITAERLEGYGTVILPDAVRLPKEEEEIIKAHAAKGARVAAIGKVSRGLMPFVMRYRKTFEFTDWAKEQVQPVAPCRKASDFSYSLDEVEGGYVLHLVSYKLDSVNRVICDLPTLEFKLGIDVDSAEVYALPGKENTVCSFNDGVLKIQNAGIYTAVYLKKTR